MNKYFFCGVWAMLCWYTGFTQQPRKDYLLNDDWYTVANDSNARAYDGFEKKNTLYTGWQRVQVPHTWDRYEGYRQLKHGNRHGTAWYQKAITIEKNIAGKRLFLFFEGVNSFATVWVNGVEVGKHAGGRTSFTLDITHVAKPGVHNIIAVKAEHPPFIRTLPWVCGGCSEEQGFSEGSQPMGIFRPVHLIVTSPVRVEPFGLHVWNDTTVREGGTSQLHYTAEVKNYSNTARKVVVETSMEDRNRKVVYTNQREVLLNARQTTILNWEPRIANTRLWSPEQPYLYKAITRIREKGVLQDEETTAFGVRWVSWPELDGKGNRQLRINGKPVFINGTAEYEHILGNSHAFSETEIYARAMQVKAAGFNSFRDAHQPHNLRYQNYWDSLGILWWPQFSAHVWFDLPEFTANFTTLMRDWIKERRNSPSVILWGLQNESTLPEYFAKECSDIIREMDPGATVQRKITTCNGGSGTDWNVPQNWTGTYGGNPADYGNDLIKQLLVGEYGAWRSIDFHTEGGFDVKGPLSEDRMTQLMEMKVRLADSVQTQTTGHYHWLLYSHDNPGRVQPDEGYRYIDKVGPVNNKGLFTIWGEPTDAFYMYRSNYTSAATEPMVYIVSHTWPERWMTPGIKSGIVVYSNCDEVELFNDKEQRFSLGKRRRGGVGTHFQWDSVPVKYNVLYARGYYKGKLVAEDEIRLLHLPEAPHMKKRYFNNTALVTPPKGYDYLYRINCGGSDYEDSRGFIWNSDQRLYNDDTVCSWADQFAGLSPVQASQRTSSAVYANTADQALFQTYRYGRDALQYKLPVEDGDYLVVLYFTEPWYGIGGGMDCRNWRVFDVAVNGKKVLHKLDIWKEVGTDKVLKKMVPVHITGGKLTVSFPQVYASQAVIAAIGIAKEGYESDKRGRRRSGGIPYGWKYESWLDKGKALYSDSAIKINYLPPLLYGDNWIKTAFTEYVAQKSDTLINMHCEVETDVYIALDSRITSIPAWMKGYEPVKDSLVTDANGGCILSLYRKTIPAGSKLYTGPNPSGNYQMYTVILHRPTAYEKAEKIKRPVVTYPAAVAVQKGAGLDSAVAGYNTGGYAKLRAQTDTVTWKMTVGVGDTYELRFRYRTETEKQVPVWLTVRLQDGTLMRHDKVFFAPANSKWKTLYSSTGTNINAGTYTVQLVPVTGETGLMLDKLEVQ